MSKTKEISWDKLKQVAYAALEKKGLNGLYVKRLDFEIDEVEKQGANRYWTDIVNENRKFDHNKNQLLLPWLLGRVTGDANVDPITISDDLTLSTNYKKVKKYIDKHGSLPPDIHQDDDKPDIDIDCLPEARDKIKEYAAKRYGADKVASVGTWTTYKLKQAIQDTTLALGHSKERAIKLTSKLPENVDDMKDGGFGKCKDCGHSHREIACPECGSENTENPTIGALIQEHELLRQYIDEDPAHQHIVDTAANLVGKIKTMGKHAGAIIIADRPLLGNVPMAYDQKSGQWSSMWTEGRSTQLSKFGYNKWDMLGLRNLKYIYECCKMIKHNHGISFGDRMEGWHGYIDPEKDRAGIYWTVKDGKKHKISLNDPAALKLANDRKTDAVFQFDTDLAKRILSNGVRSFHDLMIFNAMGHPGPMAMIPDYVERRDDESEAWKLSEDKQIAEVLKDTAGVIVFQEQLQALWQNIAGFTAPEAQAARKAVAKKWRDKLKPIRQKWIDGAKKIIGKDSATEWWDSRMESFGRYAFNKSHSVAYCLIAYQCLWLKAHYPEEWWASTMSYCHPDKLLRYMNSARGESVEFGEVNINKLTEFHTVNNSKVSIGLMSIKNVGKSLCDVFCDTVTTIREYGTIDEFIQAKGKHKTVLERLIKLGSFRHIHPNANATWMYYQYKYCSGKTITQLRKEVRATLLEKQGWNEETIAADIKRQISDYRATWPKRTKIPPKILNYKPKPNDGPEDVMALYPKDYEFKEVLEFEKQFLGYYWHSPADLYNTVSAGTIDKAKTTGLLQGVVMNVVKAKTAKGDDMYKMFINDGKTECLLILWSSDMPQPKKLMQIDAGIEAHVKYDDRRGSFTLQRGSRLRKLWTKEAWAAEHFEYEEEDG